MRRLERLANRWIGRKPADTAAVAQARAAVAHLKPAAVVTGGSRGLGYALAQYFAEQGFVTFVIARTAGEVAAAAEKLSSATGSQVFGLAHDITQTGSGPAIERALLERGFYIDALVNNAGAGASGPFSEADPESVKRVLDLNITALTALCRHVLPQMRARRHGRILNVASLGGAVPGPGQAVYYASKAYVLSLTEALAAECSGEGVRIAVLAPGPLDTGFHADMGAEGSLYRALVPAVSLRRTARAGYWGLALGRVVIVPGLVNRLIYGALRLLPHPISVAFTEILLRRR